MYWQNITVLIKKAVRSLQIYILLDICLIRTFLRLNLAVWDSKVQQ